MQVRLDTVYVYQSELAIGLRELENCLKREKICRPLLNTPCLLSSNCQESREVVRKKDCD
jgi:hypothetical protein